MKEACLKGDERSCLRNVSCCLWCVWMSGWDTETYWCLFAAFRVGLVLCYRAALSPRPVLFNELGHTQCLWAADNRRSLNVWWWCVLSAHPTLQTLSNKCQNIPYLNWKFSDLQTWDCAGSHSHLHCTDWLLVWLKVWLKSSAGFGCKPADDIDELKIFHTGFDISLYSLMNVALWPQQSQLNACGTFCRDSLDIALQHHHQSSFVIQMNFDRCPQLLILWTGRESV